jgi:transcriptional regulator with XRE-family HTH domain
MLWRYRRLVPLFCLRGNRLAPAVIEFGEEMAQPLREIRESKGLSQDDLARLSGVAKSTIVDLELGRRKPRPSTRRKLAQALGVRPEEIIFGSGTPKE